MRLKKIFDILEAKSYEFSYSEVGRRDLRQRNYLEKKIKFYLSKKTRKRNLRRFLLSHTRSGGKKKV